MLRSRWQAMSKQLVPPRSVLPPRTDYVDRHRVPGYSPAVSRVLWADEEVTIFFRVGISPNNGISVGFQEGAISFSEPMMSVGLSPCYSDDLCFGCEGYIINFNSLYHSVLHSRYVCIQCRQPNLPIFLARMRGSLTGFLVLSLAPAQSSITSDHEIPEFQPLSTQYIETVLGVFRHF